MASDTASDGTCRAPPVSEAISFNPTAVIHGPPNDRPSRISETLATTQEVRVSIERASRCVVAWSSDSSSRAGSGGSEVQAQGWTDGLGPGEFEVLLCTQRQGGNK